MEEKSQPIDNRLVIVRKIESHRSSKMQALAHKSLYIKHMMYGDASSLILAELANIIVGRCECEGVRYIIDSLNSLAAHSGKILDCLNAGTWCVGCQYSHPYTKIFNYHFYRILNYNGTWAMSGDECICKYLPNKMTGGFKTCYEWKIATCQTGPCEYCHVIYEQRSIKCTPPKLFKNKPQYSSDDD